MVLIVGVNYFVTTQIGIFFLVGLQIAEARHYGIAIVGYCFIWFFMKRFNFNSGTNTIIAVCIVLNSN